MRPWSPASAPVLGFMMWSACGAAASVAIHDELLPGGVRVIVAAMPAEEGREARVYVGSYANLGSMADDRPGEAHLIEHVVANNRSTIAGPTRPETTKLIESNALTKPNHTSYVSVVSPDGLEWAVQGRLSKLGRVRDDPAVLARERERVAAELRRNMEGQFPAYLALTSLALGQSPRLDDQMAWAGRVPAEEIRRKIDTAYRPGNGVLVITGNIDPLRAMGVARDAAERLHLRDLPAAVPQPPRRLQLREGLSATIEGQNATGAYVVGIGWPQPPFASDEMFAFLVSDQLLLGGRDQPMRPGRSDRSPLGIILDERLGASRLWDARDEKWGAPPLTDRNPSLHTILFSVPRAATPEEVRRAVMDGIRTVRRDASDREIVAAREKLALFYESWFFDPDYRILSDHLAAFAFAGRDIRQVTDIPARLRAVEPMAVRRAIDRYLLKGRPLTVVLPPSRDATAPSSTP